MGILEEESMRAAASKSSPPLSHKVSFHFLLFYFPFLDNIMVL